MDSKKIKLNKIAAVQYGDSNEKLVILTPGFLDSKDHKHLKFLAEELSEQGYTVVRFDPTGIWESDGEIAEYTMSQMLYDLKTIQDHYNLPTILIGHSLGALVNMIYASEQKVESIISIMPPQSFVREDNYEERKVEWAKAGSKTYPIRNPLDKATVVENTVPYSFVEDSEKYNALEIADKIKSPQLFVTGEKDDIILPEQVKAIFEKASNPKQFEIMPGVEHHYRRDKDAIAKVNKRIIEFLE